MLRLLLGKQRSSSTKSSSSHASLDDGSASGNSSLEPSSPLSYQMMQSPATFQPDFPIKGKQSQGEELPKFSSFMSHAACMSSPVSSPNSVVVQQIPWWKFNVDESNGEEKIDEEDMPIDSVDDACFVIPEEEDVQEEQQYDVFGESKDDDSFTLPPGISPINAAFLTRSPRDSLDFQPRLQEYAADEHTIEFVQDAPTCPADKCFDNVLMVSPDYFDTLAQASQKEKIQEEKTVKEVQSATLSSMVHPMNLELFQETPEMKSTFHDSSCSGSSSHSSSTTATTHRNENLLHMDQYTISEQQAAPTKKNPFESIRKKLASSFRSKTGKRRVAFSLSASRRGGMSREDYEYAKSLLPSKPLLSRREQRNASDAKTIPRTVPSIRDRPLSILLLNPVLKVFEIVLVDVLRDTTVGDVLSRARAYATDENLSEQKYVSLCNRKQELAAPMLPVSLLIKTKSTKKPVKPEDVDRMHRREMESRLLVAVPEGYTAALCQTIRRVLWKNPKIQRWWQQTDPFLPPDEEDIPDEIVTPTRRSRRTTVRKTPCNGVKYQKL